MMKSLALAIGFLFSLSAFAVGPQITSASGVSNVTLPTISGTTVTGAAVIFGGVAGGDCSTGATVATCNSCTTALISADPVCLTAADNLCACNTTRIFDALQITLTVKRGDATAGNIRVALGSTAPTTVGTGTGDSVTFTWAQVCAADAGGACSAASKTVAAKIFVDKNGDNTFNSTDESGVATDFSFKILVPTPGQFDVFGTNTEGIGGAQGFVPYPGDEKIYLEDIDAATNFPVLTYGIATKAVKVRVYHSDQGLASAHAESADPTDITVTADGNTLDRNVVSAGLSNNTTYVFRIAMVDEANNVVQFFPAPNADATCDAGTPFTGCPWAATPEEVLGLLTDDFNCFIATAAYGTIVEPKLKILRDFKFKVLLRSDTGRKFVGAYYKYGPYASRFIHDKPWLRAITRAALWPVFGYSALALKIGFIPATLIALVLLLTTTASLVFATRYGLRRGFARAN